MGKLPKNAKTGSKHTILVKSKGGKKRNITFMRTKKKTGFGMWKIVSNVPHKK